jgi:hypothetical protein
VLWPIACLVLATSLGVATLADDVASLALRLPSLLAAFILFAQALLELSPKRRRVARPDYAVPVEGEPEPQIVLTAAEVKLAGGYLPAQAGYPVPAEATSSGAPAKKHVPLALMLLGFWLGFAVLLAEGGSTALKVLATISAFLLFAFGWQDMAGRRGTV